MSMTGSVVPSAPSGTILGPIAFTSCEILEAAAGLSPPAHPHGHAHAHRREVVVNGKRVKTRTYHWRRKAESQCLRWRQLHSATVEAS